MIKLTLTIVILVTLKNLMLGQGTSTYYYKSNGKETLKIEKAKYSLELTKEDDKIHLTKVLLENKTIIQEIDLKSWKPIVEDGICIFYNHQNNLIKAKGYYKNGTLDSLWLYRNKNNKLDTVSYSGIKPYENFSSDKVTYAIVESMPLIGLYDDLIKQRKELDEEFKQLKTSSADNSPNSEYMNLQRKVININRLAFDRYKETNLHYPVRALESNKKGIVYADMVIDENAKVVEVKIIRGVDKDLDIETVRLIKNLPVYSCGIQRGKPVRVVMTVGVEFK